MASSAPRRLCTKALPSAAAAKTGWRSTSTTYGTPSSGRPTLKARRSSSVWPKTTRPGNPWYFTRWPSKANRPKKKLGEVFEGLLEYYRGILIMATNRADVIDRAMHSRIDLTLHYPDLEPATKEQTWRQFAGRCVGHRQGFLAPVSPPDEWAANQKRGQGCCSARLPGGGECRTECRPHQDRARGDERGGR
ncbi:hypothetical protein GGTG_06499 [Gaeumannomyces tritici R3-111a-1]|uniref:ATPase AAA-type core domain-containing protein n=1 Tax=Gaeumannomyces tritici (strain R3-111a-1) TaxID=644352 RepID=J3NYZ8_GAET3|nr:hypothetical protein GGTG_06499 [Gaeumannomyces tritici R3-111a-1]EJT76581.1 hypothetical protein GGTG_06499 [Gaeumannomyces tritici R3-111a-1]